MSKSGDKWTKEEEEFLIKNGPSKGCSYVAEKINRTVRSVQHKYGKLGLKKEETIKIGDKFNRWTFTDKPVIIKTHGKYTKFANVECDCGVKKFLRVSLVTNGYSKSCGCLSRESSRLRAIKRNTKYTLEEKQSPHMRRWMDIKNDTEWNSASDFFKWVESQRYINGHYLYKKDPNKPHSPENSYFELKTNIPDWIKLRLKEGTMKKYGVNNVFELPEIQKLAGQRRVEIYGNHSISTGKAQQEVREYFEEISGHKFISDRTILEGKEIDGYCKELLIAFEYCGLYWHNESSPQPRGKDYHIGKFESAKELGIKLITIFGDEWENKKELTKHYIKEVLGKNNNFLGDDISLVDNNIAKEWLEQNCIYGNDCEFEYSICISKESEIMGLICFSDFGDISFISYFCSKIGYSLESCAELMSILFSEYKTVIASVDNRWGNNIYEKLGFKIVTDGDPDYDWVSINNTKFRAKTNEEINGKSGKIWNCGSTIYAK